jgi:hypothetical protein
LCNLARPPGATWILPWGRDRSSPVRYGCRDRRWRPLRQTSVPLQHGRRSALDGRHSKAARWYRVFILRSPRPEFGDCSRTPFRVNNFGRTHSQAGAREGSRITRSTLDRLCRNALFTSKSPGKPKGDREGTVSPGGRRGPGTRHRHPPAAATRPVEMGNSRSGRAILAVERQAGAAERVS